MLRHCVQLSELKHDTEQYKWAYVEANLQVRKSGKANVDMCRILLPSEWQIDYLQFKLQNYHDKEIIDLLRYGFPIECDVTRSQVSEPDNHTGARFFPNDIDAYIDKEIKKGTLIGPFNKNPFGEHARFSPLNSRPKKDSHERRVIMDLSFPENNSINTLVRKDI